MALQVRNTRDTSPAAPAPSARVSRFKSKTGCLNCKRRKVKCDEAKPACKACARFQVTCHYLPAQPCPSSPRVRRRRGRPRKDWSSILPQPDRRPRTSSKTPPNTIAPSITSPPAADLNIAQAELLYHYITFTSPLFGASNDPQDPIGRFFSQSAVQMSFTNRFLLPLILSLAGRHLAFLHGAESHLTSYYRTLSEGHFIAGAGGLSAAYASMDESTCGVVYVASWLLSVCTFAAGPTHPDDLLLCHPSQPQHYLSPIHGNRLVLQVFSPGVVFTGPLASLALPGSSHKTEPKPGGMYGTKWPGPLRRLYEAVASHGGTRSRICGSAVAALAETYQVEMHNSSDLPKQTGTESTALTWICGLSVEFREMVQEKDPWAMIILAYYTPLLKAMRRSWYMQGWAEHLLDRVRTCVDHEEEQYSHWLRWPQEMLTL